jgi:hypothetical protein
MLRDAEGCTGVLLRRGQVWLGMDRHACQLPCLSRHRQLSCVSHDLNCTVVFNPTGGLTSRMGSPFTSHLHIRLSHQSNWGRRCILVVCRRLMLASLPVGCFTTLQTDNMLPKVQHVDWSNSAGLCARCVGPCSALSTSQLHAIGVSCSQDKWQLGAGE